MNRRRFGWRRSPANVPTHVGAHLADLLAGPASGAMDRDLSSAALAGPGVMDQPGSSCVGHGIVAGAETRLVVVGTPVSHRSPVGVYDFARRREDRALVGPDVPLPPLRDLGSVPSYAFEGITAEGMPAYDERPSDEATINDPPTLAEFESARDVRLEGYSRIDVTGPARIAQFRNAIAADFPVTLAIQADEAFEKYTGGVLGPPDPTKILGGHYICAIGFRTLANGKTVLKAVNSWSPFWGMGGFVEFDEDAMQVFSDCYVMNIRRVAA